MENMPEETAPTGATAPEGVGEGLASEQPAAVGSEDAGNASNDQFVTVKIDGVEQQVPLSEAIAGYQRQSDYTRKSQTVAQREQELAQADALYKAFEADPLGTLELLSEQFEPLRQQLADNGDEFVDPLEAKLNEHDEFIQQQREAARVQEVNAELARLQQQFGDFDREALLQHAIEWGGVPLEMALTHMRQMNGQADRAAAEQAALEAKRNLPATAGGSAAAGSTGRRSDGPPTSVKQALREALDEAGYSALPPIDPF